MKVLALARVGGAAAALFASPAWCQGATPNTMNEALKQGYEVVAAVGQNTKNQDHVVYLKKSGQLIVCGYRFVLTDKGLDADKSGNIGTCTTFK